MTLDFLLSQKRLSPLSGPVLAVQHFYSRPEEAHVQPLGYKKRAIEIS